jgi:RNA polymerase sigma-70 factor (ECF subfamily)
VDDDFSAWYEATYAELVRALVVVTASVPAAEDCAQEAFVRAAGRWRFVRSLENPRAWVRRVAINIAIDQHRKGVRESVALARSNPRGATGEPSSAPIDVVRAVRRLSPKQQQTVILFYLLDMPVEEVASTLRRPVNTVKSDLSRARKTLSIHLGNDLEANHK